jgi:2-polyprenyl-3-methyl-5-hydroxy-6-metoxy-1,4-benzoquinol methylase
MASLLGCPVCGSTERRVLYRDMTDRAFKAVAGSWDLHRCAGCGAAYLDPPPSNSVLVAAYAGYCTHAVPTVEQPPDGLLATVRRALRNGLVNARYGYDLTPSTRLAPLLLAPLPGVRGDTERAFRHLQKRARLLDVGCGSGNFVAHAEAVGWEATGIDVDEEALQAGRSVGYDLRVQTLDQHPEGDYDAITLGHVIEHVPDPVALLSAARERLTPDGVVWLATPNLASLGHRRYRDAWFALDPPRHLVLFDHHSLQLALSRAGFSTLADAPHAPVAGALFQASEAISRGERGEDWLCTPRFHVRGTVADAAARRDPHLGEEIVVLVAPR